MGSARIGVIALVVPVLDVLVKNNAPAAPPTAPPVPGGYAPGPAPAGPRGPAGVDSNVVGPPGETGPD